MPPSPLYNWLCVLHTTSDILSNIARQKAAQVAPGCVAATSRIQKRRRVGPSDSAQDRVEHFTAGNKPTSDHVDYYETRPGASTTTPTTPLASRPAVDSRNAAGSTSQSATIIPQHPIELPSITRPTPKENTETPPQPEMMGSEPTSDLTSPRSSFRVPTSTRTLQSSKVPSSRIGRLLHYGGLAASLGYGAATELLRRTGSGSDERQGSLIMTEANIRRLVSKLSQMRGAALKLGQFLSIQDTHLLPPDVDAIFRRVQDSAHYMPDSQLNQTLISELGADWESQFFASFDRIPFAAASIGQVHSASLLPTAALSYPGSSHLETIPVAVKVQFPNIRNSIDSDLSYVRMLLTASKILPKAMFLDRTIDVMKAELADECLYTREASFLEIFRKEFLAGDHRFKVPWVWEGSTDGVLVMERVEGISVGEAQKLELTQEDRNEIAARIIELCLKELFEFRTMQTDPNWTNFLWNPSTRQIELVDFGATRTYTKEFMDNWLQFLKAAASDDHEACRAWSIRLGYLTGEENDIMLKAHTTSMTLLAAPFKSDVPQPFGFGPNSAWAEATKEIRSFIPVMLQHRLTPPPRETYSLNRKLSGAFLLATRLDASVDTKAIWDKVVSGYKFE